MRPLPRGHGATGRNLAPLRAGKPLASRDAEIGMLKEVGQAMRDASICGLGQTASSAIESASGAVACFQVKAAGRRGMSAEKAPVATIPIPRGPLPILPAAT